MEHPQGLKKSVSRARSLDRSQNSKKDLEPWASQRLSLPATHTRRERPCTASDGSRRSENPAQPSEAQGTTGAALNLEESKEFLPSEQRPPQDTKKDKTQRRGQQGWWKSMMNFLLRTGSEETKEKAGRKAKGKEGLPQPAETFESLGEPALRKKAHDKKTRRKKHNSKKHVDEENKGTQDQEAKGQEAALPKTTAALRPEEADLSPAPRGKQTMPVSMGPHCPTPKGEDALSWLLKPLNRGDVEGETTIRNNYQGQEHCEISLRQNSTVIASLR